MIKAEEIKANYETHIKIINHYIPSPRKEKVLQMIESLGENYYMSPASGKTWYHNAFPGGYLNHVNNVVKYAIKQHRLYEEMGGTIDYSEEELVFSALFHDLGKIGDGNAPQYIPQTDKWRQEKLQEAYTNNPDIPFMMVPDRSLFLLQKFGIPVNEKEYLAIMLHDGIFDEGNKPYFFSNQESSRQRTSIISVLHTADFLASKVEYDIWKKNQ